MSKQYRTSRFVASIFGAILVLLLVSAAAYAAWTTIDTNDAAIDTNWGDPKYTSTCNDPGVADDYEIRNAWYRYDGDSFYFRVETCVGPALGSDGSGRLSAGIDCTGDGQVNASGDRAVTYNDSDGTVALFDGLRNPANPDGYTSDATYAEKVVGPDFLNVEWKTDLMALPPACRGSISPVLIGWETGKVTMVYTPVDTTGAIIEHSNPMDYGDLPNPPGSNPYTSCPQGYPSRSPCDGARHGVATGYPVLGSTVDPDDGSLQNVTATADDTTNTGSADDEEGVAPSAAFAWSMASGGSLDVTVSGGSGYLSCWIDWNNNNNLADNEQLELQNLPVSNGSYTVPFAVPVTPSGLYYSRCRVSPTEDAGVAGAIYGGEVEDYRWLPQTATLEIGTSGASDALLSWNTVSASDRYDLYRSATPYFTPSGAPLANDVNASSYVDVGVLGPPPNVYFYRLVKERTADSTTFASVPSNEVGLFEYSIVPGG